MTRRETSFAFLHAFCAGDIERLASLLTEDLQFQGPFLQADSRDAYLRRLKEDPPGPCEVSILKLFEDEEETCLFYEYIKPHVTVLIAQRNRFRGDRIAEITLVFDGSTFS